LADLTSSLGNHDGVMGRRRKEENLFLKKFSKS
jgi:hypothetical protein